MSSSEWNVATTKAQHDWVAGGRGVPAGNAALWLGAGWTLFSKSPGMWILNLVLMFVGMMVVSVVPLIGGIAANLLIPVLLGGLLLGCKALDDGEPMRVEHLFAGFKDKAGKLVTLGVLMFVFSLLIAVVAMGGFFAVFGSGLLRTLGQPQAFAAFLLGNWLLFALVFLVALALTVPLSMAVWFAPALVMLHDVEPWEAMKQSFTACLRNVLPLLVYGVIFFVLAILAAIPFGLGLFVLVPVAYAAWYAAYKDIFVEA